MGFACKSTETSKESDGLETDQITVKLSSVKREASLFIQGGPTFCYSRHPYQNRGQANTEEEKERGNIRSWKEKDRLRSERSSSDYSS